MNPITAIQDNIAIVQQDAEVFIKRQSNIVLIMTVTLPVTLAYNNFLILSCPIELFWYFQSRGHILYGLAIF